MAVRRSSPYFRGPRQARREDLLHFVQRSHRSFREDGKVIWNCKTVANATESSPLIVKDRIIVADYNGKVSAVDFDGLLIWQHDIAADAPARPRVSTVTARERQERRLDPARPQATTRPSSCRSSINPGSPSSTSRRAGFGGRSRRRAGSTENRLSPKTRCSSVARTIASIASTRKEKHSSGLFQRSLGSRQESLIRMARSTSARATVVSIRVNAETGKEVWSYQTPNAKGARTAIYSAPLCTEDAVYFGSFDGHLYCLKIDNGQLNWRIQPVKDSEITGSPLTDGRRIVV